MPCVSVNQRWKIAMDDESRLRLMKAGQWRAVMREDIRRRSVRDFAARAQDAEERCRDRENELRAMRQVAAIDAREAAYRAASTAGELGTNSRRSDAASYLIPATNSQTLAPRPNVTSIICEPSRRHV